MIRETFEAGEGILRLAPVFVPRRFGQPGYRLRLHPDDYFALGTSRGAFKERWLASTIPAMNGPLAPPDEGLSYVIPRSGRVDDRFALRDAVAELGDALVGPDLMTTHGGWPMYSKFFDYGTPLFHHLHLSEEAARRVGRRGKPEAYYFPPQLNNHPGVFPHTWFGFDPDCTRAAVRERLLRFEAGDNRITELSRAYRIQLGTGWYTPPGVVHAPGSCLTYEPQWNSDVNSVYENIVWGEVYPYEFLVENCPEDHKRDVDYVLDLMDWGCNVDPRYKARFFRPPLPCGPEGGAYDEAWVAYGNDYVAAKELTLPPRTAVTVVDRAAHGVIVVQGHGTFGPYETEAAGMLRFGGPSADEFFVSEGAARRGVRVANRSACEPLVMLKHFGPNAGAPAAPIVTG